MFRGTKLTMSEFDRFPQMFVNRPIRHPLFKNLSMVEAAGELEHKDVGECLFRPSAKGTNQLCITIKLHQGPEGPYLLHREIREGPKVGVFSGL
jgi:transcription elongation factor SPT6